MVKTSGIVNLVAGVLVAFGFVVFFFRFLVGYSHFDLHDLFDEGSFAWGLVHTNFWVVTIPIGVLVGVLHKWMKDEKILAQGLAELREWRAR